MSDETVLTTQHPRRRPRPGAPPETVRTDEDFGQDPTRVLGRPATGTVYPPRAVWESPGPGRDEQPLTAAAFSRARADAFLHHHLLWGHDVLGGGLRSFDVPGLLAEAFAACWAVTVDGRLARRELPGYSLTERRGRFSRLFSTGGVLMPGHWEAFQGLWEGLSERPREVVAVARRLPRLHGRGT